MTIATASSGPQSSSREPLLPQKLVEGRMMAQQLADNGLEEKGTDSGSPARTT